MSTSSCCGGHSGLRSHISEPISSHQQGLEPGENTHSRATKDEDDQGKDNLGRERKLMGVSPWSL